LLEEGLPKISDKVLYKASKRKTASSKTRKRNKRVNYKSSNGTVIFDFAKHANNPGELDVDGINSVYVGRHIVRNGDRKQTYSRVPDPLIEFYHKNKNYFNNFKINLDDAVIIDGCFKTNKTILQRTMIPENSSAYSCMPSMKLIKDMKPAIVSTIRKLRIPALAKNEIGDLPFTSFNMKTYPGFHYKEYGKFDTKGDAIKSAFSVATSKWKYITKCTNNKIKLERNKLFPGTFAVGARNKRDFPSEKLSEVTSRAVHMPEFHNEIHSGCWTDPISSHIRDEAKGPIYIGNSFVDYQRLYKDMFKCESIIEGDVSRFDSRIYVTFIVIAVAISRLYYDIDDEEIDNHFIAIFDSIAIKDYYTPGGFIYRMIHGLPSGVKSTSLFGSIINLVLQSHFCSNVSSKLTNFCIGGDDFLIGFKNKMGDDQVHNIEKRAKDVGWELKYLAEKSFHSTNINDRPFFYKYTIDNDEPVISTITLIERVFAPWNKKYRNCTQLYKFLIDIMPSLGAPRSNFLIYYEICSYVKYRLLQIHSPPSYFFAMHKSVYDKVMNRSLFLLNKNKVSRVNCSLMFDKNNSGGKLGKYMTNGKKKIIKVPFLK